MKPGLKARAITVPVRFVSPVAGSSTLGPTVNITAPSTPSGADIIREFEGRILGLERQLRDSSEMAELKRRVQELEGRIVTVQAQNDDFEKRLKDAQRLELEMRDNHLRLIALIETHTDRLDDQAQNVELMNARYWYLNDRINTAHGEDLEYGEPTLENEAEGSDQDGEGSDVREGSGSDVDESPSYGDSPGGGQSAEVHPGDDTSHPAPILSHVEELQPLTELPEKKTQDPDSAALRTQSGTSPLSLDSTVRQGVAAPVAVPLAPSNSALAHISRNDPGLPLPDLSDATIPTLSHIAPMAGPNTNSQSDNGSTPAAPPIVEIIPPTPNSSLEQIRGASLVPPQPQSEISSDPVERRRSPRHRSRTPTGRSRPQTPYSGDDGTRLTRRKGSEQPGPAPKKN